MTDNNNTEKVTVIGLGTSGVKIAQTVAALPGSDWINIHGIDTDRKVIDASSLANKHLIMQSHDISLGCGGNVIKGSRLIARKRKLIHEIIKDSSLVVVTGGLGGGTLTGGAKSIVSVAGEAKIPCIFILSTPFALEGDVKRKVAEDGINDLVSSKGLVIPLSNDLIFSSLDGDCSATEAFSYATEHMAMVVNSFCDMMRCNNLLKIDYSTMYNVMNKKSNQCSLGCSVVDLNESKNTAQELIDGILNSPFMTGKKHLKDSDAAFFIISASEDVSLSNIKQTLELASELVASETLVCAGAATNKALDNKIMLTAVAVKFSDNQRVQKQYSSRDSFVDQDSQRSRPDSLLANVLSNDSAMSPRNNVRNDVTGVISKSNREKSDGYEEVGLGLIHYSRGYFQSTAANRFNGEDLDVPTFQRRNVTIKK